MSQSGAYRDLPSIWNRLVRVTSHTSCGNGLFALPALYGAAYVLVGQLNAVHGGEDLPQHGNHGFKPVSYTHLTLPTNREV